MRNGGIKSVVGYMNLEPEQRSGPEITNIGVSLLVAFKTMGDWSTPKENYR